MDAICRAGRGDAAHSRAGDRAADLSRELRTAPAGATRCLPRVGRRIPFAGKRQTVDRLDHVVSASTTVEAMFFNPLMLVGLGAAVLPLVLHLLSRARYRQVEWGA